MNLKCLNSIGIKFALFLSLRISIFLRICMTTVDYLSAINSSGSGLNITQIVDSLVEADTVPKKNMLDEDKTVKQTEISAFAC